MEKVKDVLKVVLSHMFCSKSLKYLLYTTLWTITVCYFWTNKLSESLEVSATIVIGKFLFYGFWDFWHIKHSWHGWKLQFLDFLVIFIALFVENLVLYLVFGSLR